MAASGSELGHFLKSRRERLTPELVGLPVGTRRRTPGLRREEVAQLAGIGIDWYIRLEQGKALNPSKATVEGLARALRLDQIERSHLNALARPGAPRAFVRETVSEQLRTTLNALGVPAYVTGRRWDVLAWNQAAEDIFAFGRIEEADRNTLILVLANRRTRALFGEAWQAEAQRMVAQFRATYDMWAHDPAFIELHARLMQDCPEFSAWWQSHDLLGLNAGLKHLEHPRKGTLSLSYSSFQANENPDLKLVLYTGA